jgi:predicted hotdog family 3-hydroxylacyl-ACP dehydratase
MRVWRLITGLTFIRFGTKQKELPTKHTNRHEKFTDKQYRSFRILRVVSWAITAGESPWAPAMANYTAINKAEIRTLIPHSDLMCLLDEVVQWDDQSIVCGSNTHRDPANPLRRQGRLSAVHAFEYGAQAAAIHGGLRARAARTIAPPGYLAALRDGRLHITRLDYIQLPLRISATRLYGEGANTVYEFTVSAATVLVAEGRVTIVERA